MNWKKFKDCVESQGVTDDMEIDEIEVHDPETFDEISVTVYDGRTFTVYD